MQMLPSPSASIDPQPSSQLQELLICICALGSVVEGAKDLFLTHRGAVLNACQCFVDLRTQCAWHLEATAHSEKPLPIHKPLITPCN